MQCVKRNAFKQKCGMFSFEAYRFDIILPEQCPDVGSTKM